MEPLEEPPIFLKADEVDGALQSDPATLGLSQQPPSDLLPPADTIDLQDRGIPQQSSTAANRPTLQRDKWAPAPQQPPPPAPPVSSLESANPTDSLSVLQLRRLVSEIPRPDPTPYAFTYEDSSSFEEEVEEIFGYAYSEREALIRTQSVFRAQWLDFLKSSGQHADTQWSTSGQSNQETFIDAQKEALESGMLNHTSKALGCLLYVALGCWHETAIKGQASDKSQANPAESSRRDVPRYRSSQQQTKAMKLALQMIGTRVGASLLVKVWRASAARDMTEEDYKAYQALNDDGQIVADQMMWSSTVLLYLLVDHAWRQSRDFDDNSLRDHFIALDPPILVTLARMIAIYRWDDSNNVPSSKLLLIFWKCILMTFGGLRELDEIKEALDEHAGRPHRSSTEPLITASPLEYHVFRQELLSKYPAFNPPPPVFPLESDSSSILSPLQDRVRNFDSADGASGGPVSINGNASSILHQPVHIATPAPSPPPSPAPSPGGKGAKKQNYQTNQMFPFLYPPLGESSNDIGGKGTTEIQDLLVGRKWDGSDVPTSILEAADLFAKRMRATRAMKQLWDQRVQFLKTEQSGQSRASAPKDGKTGPKSTSDATTSNANDVHALPPSMQNKLKAVEQFYSQCLPDIPSITIVLLKVLLQTVTALVTQPNGPSGLSGGIRQHETNGQANGRSDSYDARTASAILRDLDTLRTQEIMGKSVSGIIILLLKWFKLSHILKFEYMSQLLLDSNYVQLILKLFTHQELERVVIYRCERKNLDFFRFCHLQARNGGMPSSDSEDGTESDDAAPPPIKLRRDMPDDVEASGGAAITSLPPPPEVDELGYPTSELPASPITTYSWRNFYSSINHLRILQKIVKRKAHRQLLMVQYKYSAILKKALKVPQPEIRLYTLKIIKGQVPYCNRKWRSSNMRIITAIYLHCRPQLREEWLAGGDLEHDMGDALPLEQALRSLTYWYNIRNYPASMGSNEAKAKAAMEEEEQDFFLRELDKMNLYVDDVMDDDDFDEIDGEHIPLDAY